jgi:hypothetical protein
MIVEHVEISADRFFQTYEKLERQITPVLKSAIEVRICAALPFTFLNKHNAELRDMLNRKGLLLLILPEPGSAAEGMSRDRATDEENENRGRIQAPFDQLLADLRKFAERTGGQFQLRYTKYWPSFIMTYMRSMTQKSDVRDVLYVTMNNYGQPDGNRPSLIIERANEPRTFAAFRQDLHNMEEKSTAAPDSINNYE